MPGPTKHSMTELHRSTVDATGLNVAAGLVATADGTGLVTWGAGTPAFATPALVLGTAAAVGAATTVIRSDSTIVAFDATVPVTQAFGDAAASGSVAKAARRDHKHGMPAAPAVAAPLTASDGSGGWVLVFTPTGDVIMV